MSKPPFFTCWIKNIDINDVIEINDNDIELYKNVFKNSYLIFLETNFKCFKSSKLLNIGRFFKKYNITELNFSEKDKFNKYISKHNDTVKDTFTNKYLFFYENTIEPNILYKKIILSNYEIFIPIKEYFIKKMDFKLRSLCQIAEKLGAIKIQIKYKLQSSKSSEINVALSGFSNEISATSKTVEKSKDEFIVTFDYPNNNSVNINKYY